MNYLSDREVDRIEAAAAVEENVALDPEEDVESDSDGAQVEAPLPEDTASYHTVISYPSPRFGTLRHGLPSGAIAGFGGNPELSPILAPRHAHLHPAGQAPNTDLQRRYSDTSHQLYGEQHRLRDTRPLSVSIQILNTQAQRQSAAQAGPPPDADVTLSWPKVGRHLLRRLRRDLLNAGATLTGLWPRRNPQP